jgi:hypothetical protein
MVILPPLVFPGFIGEASGVGWFSYHIFRDYVKETFADISF